MLPLLSRLLPKPSLRRGFAAPAAAELLEGRTLPAAGALLWSPTSNFSPGTDWFEDVTVQADGKIVAVGSALVGGDFDILVARYTAGGRLDSGFGGGGGFAFYDFGEGRDDEAYSVLVQPDGKIIVGGASRIGGVEDSALIRLDPGGSYDDSFGAGGRVRIASAEGGGKVFSVALTSAGRIIAAGEHPGVDTSGAVARYQPDGTPDGSFGGGSGHVFLPEKVTGMAVDGSGRIVAAGLNGTLSRLTPDGAYDDAFDSDGRRTVDFDFGTAPKIWGLAIDSAGRVVVAGYSNVGTVSQAGIARLLPGGAYDDSFNFNGRITFDATPGVSPNDSAVLISVAALPDGGVVAVGYELSANGKSLLAVLTPDGSLDPRFNANGIALLPANGTVHFDGLVITKTGQYVLAGITTAAGGDYRPAIASFEGRFPRRDDYLGWTAGGDWYVAASTGAAFATSAYGHWNPDAGWKLVTTADLTGDGLADAVGRDGTGQWWVGVNTGRGLATAAGPKWNEAARWRDLRFADFNGDGRADVAARTYYGEWWVSLGTATGLSAGRLWDRWAEAAGWRDVLAADFNGDGRADLAGRTSYGEWWVTLSDGAKFTQRRWDRWAESAGWRDVAAADADGDGRADLVGRTSRGEWWVSYSDGTRGLLDQWGAFDHRFWNEAAGWRDVLTGDFDGDGRADVAGRTSGGQWYVGLSTPLGLMTSLWGSWSATAGWRDVRAGDFDGDGKTDLAGRASNGQWFVARSDGTKFVTALWGSWNAAAGWTAFENEFVPTRS